jgi:predicted permease
MNWLPGLFRSGRVNAEMREEMELHCAMRAEDLERQGMSAEQARRQARLEFGSIDAYGEEGRAALGYRLLDELRGDLRYAARCLKGNPGYAVAAILILGVAIGVNAAFFTLYSNYALKPLPIRAVDRHFSAESRDAKGRSAGSFTVAEMQDLEAGSRGVVEGLYGVATYQALVLAPVQKHGMISLVSARYFELLGGKAALGRVLGGPDMNRPVVVMSENGRRRFFASAASPIGQSLRLGDLLYEVVGVMPSSFTGTEALVPDFWVGVEMKQPMRGAAIDSEPRLPVFGYLKPETSVDQAETALTAIAARFARPGREPVALMDVELQRSYIPDTPEVQMGSAALFVVFLLVLLIACANLTNLSLARAAARTHEIGMRLSLGASRARLIRQLLTESLFTAMLGAGLGFALALVSVRSGHEAMSSLSGVLGLTVLPMTLDWRVMLFSMGLGLVAGLVFGLLPALEATAPSLVALTRRPRRIRNVLIGAQVAASLVLLIGGGVLVRNLQRIDAMPAGYDLDRVYDLKLDQASAAMLREIERVPGVSVASAVERVPLYGRMNRMDVTVGETKQTVYWNRVDEKYARVLGLEVVAGRWLDAREAALQAKVAVVSAATAKKLWPGRSALGQTFRSEELGVHEVVGVVPDVMSGFLFEGMDTSSVYLPGAAGQKEMVSTMARVEGDGPGVVAALRGLCLSGPGGTGCEPARLRDVSAMQRFPFQAMAIVASVLGVVALVLTAVGLYSVTRYAVLQRRREIGICLAIGARPGQVVGQILRESAWCLLGGAMVGLPICLVLSRLASSALLRIDTYDPVAYVGVVVLLGVVALGASLWPAQMAARMDPMESLRTE